MKLACRVLAVSESGLYAQRDRPPSARAIRHAALTDLIGRVHLDSRGTWGARRVHAELTLGHGLVVGHNAIELLMRRAGLAGVSGRPRFRRIPNVATASDLVERQFSRGQPDRLWVTDITEHPTREGKVYCAVVLDVFSRRVVGWSIDASPTAALVTNAMGMAIEQRGPRGTVIHSDQGTRRWRIQPVVATPSSGRWAWDDHRDGSRRRAAGQRCARRGARRPSAGSSVGSGN